jgi:hypothetical protein
MRCNNISGIHGWDEWAHHWTTENNLMKDWQIMLHEISRVREILISRNTSDLFSEHLQEK